MNSGKPSSALAKSQQVVPKPRPSSSRVAHADAPPVMHNDRAKDRRFFQQGRSGAQDETGARRAAFNKTLPVLRLSPVSETPGAHADGWAYRNAKRAIDIVGAIIALFILFPALLVISFLVWREDHGPILFYQTRIGRDGAPFHFYKFRSMSPNAEALKDQIAAKNEAGDVIFKIKNDPRVTRIGRVLRKYSLDELPQFMNVLRGEMSLVGPRPHLPREVEKYTEEQKQRLQAQPGLLCFREIQGRSNLTFEQWVESDLLYIKHRSLWVDAYILLRAIPAILKADGAC